MDPHLRFYPLFSHLYAILLEVHVVSGVYRMVEDNGKELYRCSDGKAITGAIRRPSRVAATGSPTAPPIAPPIAPFTL